ncbi:unnamed protein product, partial [Rotaria socialis]
MADYLFIDNNQDKVNGRQNDPNLSSRQGPLYSTMIENVQERILSQKMTELTTSVIPTTTKRIQNSSILIDKKIQERLEKIPTYLTKENKTFQSIIDQALRMMNVSMTNDKIQNDLQDVSILLYQIQILSMYHLLWTSYWESGVGQLIKPTSERQTYIIYAMNISIWPKEIQRLLKSMDEQSADMNQSSMDIVSVHRQELQKQLRQTEIEWNKKVNHISGYSLKVEQLLKDYILRNVYEFQKEIEHKIELVTIDYHIEAIKREFDRQNATEYQKKLMKQLCLKKDEKETTEQELKFLQERMHHFNVSDQCFKDLALIDSTMIDSIENVEIRQLLQKQSRELIQQAKADFCTLILKTAEDQRTRA